ncbi:uncharacterized protein LOC125208399 isoform X2 [Salvia hispanica]|uniref:uncharacterized protein LOC125208399 isoform X2 n=1 Tax=Salvia hispanica TaxID=49212 RepID=UPI0020094C72|nr:uncharacterized protein LOC125208399 isoform X2 [Salvia hispanica]
MELEFFTNLSSDMPINILNLPSDMTINILSRLSTREIAISKCVCKPWLNLIESNDIVKSKIKTASSLVHFTASARCTIFEIEDEDEADLDIHDLHYHPLTDLVIPHGNRESMEATYANDCFFSTHQQQKLVLCQPPLLHISWCGECGSRHNEHSQHRTMTRWMRSRSRHKGLEPASDINLSTVWPTHTHNSFSLY